LIRGCALERPVPAPCRRLTAPGQVRKIIAGSPRLWLYPRSQNRRRGIFPPGTRPGVAHWHA
jgi:hypothetical protein